MHLMPWHSKSSLLRVFKKPSVELWQDTHVAKSSGTISVTATQLSSFWIQIMRQLSLFRACKEVGGKKGEKNEVLHPRQLRDFSLCSRDTLGRHIVSDSHSGLYAEAQKKDCKIIKAK